MSIDDEKVQVRLLRESGLTLTEIAKRLGRSIYWVNARLNQKYEPQRERRVAAHETTRLDPETVPNEMLSGEIELIKSLRASGATYQTIADQLGRSVYWVHSRLDQNYRPRKGNSEKVFQEERVVPWLIAKGHTNVSQYPRVGGKFYRQEADIISRLDDRLFITEVKVRCDHHELQTALGQLNLHRLAYSEGEAPGLQIVFPAETRTSRITDDVLAQIQMKEGISIHFIV